jgi:tetratricopeptide (TPR) repeat protein
VQPGVTVELPQHLPAYWRALIDRDQTGTPTWRNAQRQLMVAAAALEDRTTVFGAYEQLREHGGVERGDLALASGGIATASTDEQFAAALAPLAKEPIARYLIAGRAYGKNPKPARMAPETRDGQLGALWSLRYVSAHLAANATKAATDELLAMGSRAFMLRLIGATVIGQHYEADVKDLTRAWDSVATGDYKNVVAMQLAQVLFSRGQYDAGAERVAKLAAELDLNALPANFQVGQYQFTYSRRGEAGWQLAYATWRDRVLAGSSLEHLIALLPAANQHIGDTPRILARAIEVAGQDRDRRLALARIAIQYGQAQMANDIIEPMLTSSPSRELYQLAAQQQLASSHPEHALELYEKAEDAGADEEVDVQTVRNELTQIISLCRQLAVQGTGAYRAKYIGRALAWGQRWRMIDPDNDDIDRQLGQLMLAVGDTEGAWRQLSSAIERDPWAGSGYATVADAFEHEGKVAEALDLWQQAIVIDQTNPTHRLRKAQALIALGRTAEGDALLHQITSQKWHDMWSSVVYQAQNLIDRGKAQTK